MQIELDETPSRIVGESEAGLELGRVSSRRDGRVEPRRVTALIQSASSERNGIVSPDGRWLAYDSNDSGRYDIWVRPFPEVNSGRWQVTTSGGSRPLWARSGQELDLVYVSPAGALMRVTLTRAASWAATTPTELVKEGYVTNSLDLGRSYDLTPSTWLFSPQLNTHKRMRLPAQRR